MGICESNEVTDEDIHTVRITAYAKVTLTACQKCIYQAASDGLLQCQIDMDTTPDFCHVCKLVEAALNESGYIVTIHTHCINIKWNHALSSELVCNSDDFTAHDALTLSVNAQTTAIDFDIQHNGYHVWNLGGMDFTMYAPHVSAIIEKYKSYHITCDKINPTSSMHTIEEYERITDDIICITITRKHVTVDDIEVIPHPKYSKLSVDV
jgi:hypothetical protein